MQMYHFLTTLTLYSLNIYDNSYPLKLKTELFSLFAFGLYGQKTITHMKHSVCPKNISYYSHSLIHAAANTIICSFVFCNKKNRVINNT